MKTRLAIWFTGCLAISLLVFDELWSKLPEWFSSAGLYHHGIFHWGVLGLCVLWLWLKRKEIFNQMQTWKLSPPFIIIGIALTVLSISLPRSDDFLVFLMLAGWLGIFSIIFTRASILPSILLIIYGFSVTFPLLMNRWTGESASVIVANTATAITRTFGLPLTNERAIIYFNNPGRDVISTTVVPGCVGYATIGVFIALFALMMLDIKLPLKKTWYIFLIGLAGTCLQNIIRIIISLVAGYYWGIEVLEAIHHNAAYVIFPLWYSLFVYIYLKQAGWRKSPVREKSEDNDI